MEPAGFIQKLIKNIFEVFTIFPTPLLDVFVIVMISYDSETSGAGWIRREVDKNIFKMFKNFPTHLLDVFVVVMIYYDSGTSGAGWIRREVD